MNNHLSEDQFETCVFGRAGQAELEHISQCPECRAEVERFSHGLALFQRAVRDLAGESGALQDVDFTTLSTSARTPRWGLTLAVASLVAAMVLPFFVTRPNPIAKAPVEASPEAVMERLNRHLESTVPEAMEPLMSLISREQPGSQRDGVQ